MSNLIDRLKAFDIASDTEVVFTWKEACDIMHYNEDWHEDAFVETGVINELAEAATTGVFYKNGNWALDTLRDEGLLEGYERGSEEFTGFCADAMGETVWDHGWVEQEVTRYDHKRGSVEMSFTMKAPWRLLRDSSQYFTDNWSATVNTENAGYVTLNGSY